MRLALAQIDTTVGDLDGNRARILGRLEEAKAAGADLVLFPELAVTGYPPEDLLLRPGFVRAAEESLGEIARATHGITALVWYPHLTTTPTTPARSAPRELKAIYRKRFLPNYGVFDDDRYFAPARDLLLREHGGTPISPTICEDLWQPGPPATDLAHRRRPAPDPPPRPRRSTSGATRAGGDSSPRARRTARASSRSATPSAARTS